MFRKAFLAPVAATVAIALLVTIGTDVASANSAKPALSPVTFAGNISCNLQGKLSISPPATLTSAGPWTVTFTGTNNKCVGLGTTSLTQGGSAAGGGETLKSSKESFTFTIVNVTGALGTLCTDLETGGPIATPVNTTINWLGTSPITPSAVVFPNGGTFLPGLIQLVNGPTGGSFAGTTDILLGYNLATVWTQCATATGLATLPVNHLGGDNLMVGTAF